MQILQTEGVVLKTIDFRDYDQIMTVFTPERGIVKLIFKKRKPAPGLPSVKIAPLVRAEFVYTETKGDIWKCREISLLNQYLKLRENYGWLETAGHMVQWILTSQVEHKPAPKLYQLMITYLEKIPLTDNLKALEISFIFHLLKQEGLINLDLYCSICQKPLRSLYMAQGDHFCSVHAPLEAVAFNEEETLAWMQVAASTTFSRLKDNIHSRKPALKKLKFFSKASCIINCRQFLARIFFVSVRRFLAYARHLRLTAVVALQLITASLLRDYLNRESGNKSRSDDSG